MKYRNLMIVTVVAFSMTFGADGHENTIVIPFYDDNNYVATASNPVAPENRDISEYISFSGLAYDEITKLAWQKGSDAELRTWRQAFEYCRSLRLANQNQWRLPTLEELFSIVNLNDTDPAINTDVFAGTIFAPSDKAYWTATRDITINPNTFTDLRFYTVSFKYGSVRAERDHANPTFAAKHYTRCVI